MKFHQNKPKYLIFSQILSALVASAASDSRSDWPSLIQRLRREVVDLHSGEFCVDVSTYKDVEFLPESQNKCSSTFEKRCEDKTEQVSFWYRRFSYTVVKKRKSLTKRCLALWVACIGLKPRFSSFRNAMAGNLVVWAFWKKTFLKFEIFPLNFAARNVFHCTKLLSK